MRNGKRSRHSPARPTRPPCTPIATAIAKASPIAPSTTRKPTRACSIACWPGSAAVNWSAPRRSLKPAPTTIRRRESEVLRLLSLAAFLATWWIAALLAGSTKLPAPPAVLATVISEAESGALFLHLGATLARVALAFVLAMSLGSAIGYLMGRVRLANRLGDPWLILLLNLPALVVIVLAYIWAGLTEAAAIAAIAINKLPTAVVTLREGTALDPSLDEMAAVFAIPRARAFR